MSIKCDGCRENIGGWGGRDPARTKTCDGPARHVLCSVCHKGRSSCPICGKRLS